MNDTFDFSELESLNEKFLQLATDKMPKDSKKFMKKQGTQLKKVVKSNANKIKKKTGKYRKSIKSGKVYKYNGAYAVRAYSKDRKAHLIEYGHRIVTKNGIEKGFIDGQHVFEKSGKQFENKFYENVENFIDEMLDKGL